MRAFYTVAAKIPMSKKLFGKQIEPKCVYCALSVLTEDKKSVLCEKKGFTTPDGFCKKFIYDPTKRAPVPSAPPLPDFEESDFCLTLEDENG